AQPRARSHVASSVGSASRNASRAGAEWSFQATITSQAGAPPPIEPQSITPMIRPFRTSQLRQSRSPWCQTGGPSPGGAPSAPCQASPPLPSPPNPPPPGPLRPARAVESPPPVPHLLVAHRERDAAPRRRAGRIHSLQGQDERREVPGGLNGVDLVDRDDLALDPGMDLPEPGIVRARPSLCQRHRNLDRQPRRQLRQPLELDAARLGRPLLARQPYREPVAEPEDRVHGPVRLDP